MKNLLSVIVLACALASPVFASQHSASPATSQGEVRKIDAANQKITLRHGPLANLGRR